MKGKFDYTILDKILADYQCSQSSVIAILQDVQEHYHYLPKDIFPYIAKKLDTSVANIYSVATFYENFSFDAKGKYIIKVCDGTACHVRKSQPVKDAIVKELGLEGKKCTTEDMMFTVETVSCLGACGLAPTMMVNEDVHPKMTPDKAVKLIRELRGGNQE